MSCPRTEFNGETQSVNSVKCYQKLSLKTRLSHLCNKKCPQISGKQCAKIVNNYLPGLWFKVCVCVCVSTFCTFQDFGSEHVFDHYR